MRAPEKLLLRLEWRVVRRLDGRLQGGHRTVHRGAGTDFAGLRAYVEGDDARHIDWNVTARLNEAHLRQFNEDREMTVWLALDRSASMAAGRPGRGKHEVLAELTLVLARLFSRGGNRVGALLFDTGVLRVVPPGTERRHVLRIGAELERTAGTNSGRTTDLAEMLDAVARLARRRSLVVVVSDFIGEGDWERSLLRLARRHEVVALRIVDTADDELPEAGLIVVEDAETGEQLIVDSGDPLFQVRFREAVSARDARLADGMREAGVPVHRVDTARDLAETLVEVVARTRDRRA
ncbi:hypothetical protein Aph01nite_17660 [Acrocarpospora phusangensis]|uniref:VWFA domain-containing protein n=1 Tax=Acrocarpospora phusangensis TaxID=1070424 RepID=A0A919Q777_9ACTN|nr:DUF58 domain-containing protein [Acrocarpospora phusangensis]GIH23456.1 hypothetical protein Aph01nite_17660 [Acrocarpospora phusangensis]